MFIQKHLLKLTFAFIAILGFKGTAFAQTFQPYNYWTFDGSNSLKDSMNQSDLNALYYNSPYSIANSGSSGVGKCLNFTDATTKIVASNTLPLDTGFTIEFLFRPSPDINQTVQFFTRRDNAVSCRFNYAFIRFTTKIIPTGSTTAVNDNLDITLEGTGRGSYNYYTDGNWHHIAFKYNAKTGIKEVWVDGQLPDGFSDTVSVTGRFPSNSTNVNSNICDLNTVTSYYKYAGDLDEFAVYTYALPSNMIYKHYNEFKQKHHYSFSNSTIAPPAADPVIGQVDPYEYAPGYPAVTVDALDQVKGFPTPRFKPGNTLKANIPIFSAMWLGGFKRLSNSLAVSRSVEFQREYAANYHYSLIVTGNTHNVGNFGDTTTFDGAWIKLANDNPSWETTAMSFWHQLSPSSIGKAFTDPYMLCGCLPNSSYLRNSQGQFLDKNGNVTTGKVISPEAPLDSVRLDGQTQRFYISSLLSKMTRPLNNLFENAEVVYHYNPSGIANDPTVAAAINASGLTPDIYVSNRMRRFSDAYMNEYTSLPQLSNTRLLYFQISGHPYSFDYGQTRTLNSAVHGQHLATGDIYNGNPRNWRDHSANMNGWQHVVDERIVEIGYGDSLFSPLVGPGWNDDETKYTRAGQWLGLLKAYGMTGIEHYQTGYFVLTDPPLQDPKNWVWITVIPSYAQGITSRYEDLLRNGHLMDGDVPNTVLNTSQPGYSFKAGEFNKLVVARKHNTLNKYAITGTIQPNSNIQGSAPIAGNATINLDGQTLKFEIRRQGSTYIYDKTNPSAPVFYQLDGWHEYMHPSYWSKTFNIEAELFDNTSSVTIKTSVPTGTVAGDYTNYTSYVSFTTAGTVEYNFQPRGATPTTHYVWVLARSKDGSAQSFTVSLDGANAKSVGCVQDTNWTWYRYDATTGTPLAFNNLSSQNHKIGITCSNTKVEIDKITITPTSGNYYTANVAPICSTGVAGVATITASGNTTFCQGDSVILSANTGTAYLWSTGAVTKSITVTTAGSYIVTVTNGTSAISTPQTVIVNSLPSNGVNASGVTTFCSGGSVTLTAASATGTYLWSPGGQTTRAITATAAGNYSVVVTNAGNCSATSPVTTVTLTSSGTPATISTSGATSFCQGGSVNLTANSGVSYLWSNGATSRTISSNTAGNYFVTVTYATGCNSTSSITTVTVNPIPSNVVTASGSTTICSGGSVTLTSNSSTGTYLWSPGGQTTQAITVTNAGNYSVIATGAGNCSSTSAATAVTVSGTGTPASITPSGATTFCQGGSVSLNANTGSGYLWSTGATTSSIIANSTNTYTVTVFYAGGCNSVSPAKTVTVNPIPSNGVTVSGPTTFCNGGSVSLTANSTSGSYLWSPGGETTQSITASNAGNYSVVVTGTGNCSSASAVTAVTVNSNTPATISSAGATTFCQGGSVNLTANSGSSYLWSTGATTRTISANSTGNYLVTVTYSAGCNSTSPATAVIANPIPSNGVTASGPTSFCNGGSVVLTANNSTGSYLWSNGAVSRSINVGTSGNYVVTVTSANCSATSLPVNVIVSTGTIITPTVTSGNGNSYLCEGASMTLVSTPATNYLWSTGETTRTINITAGGTFSVTTANNTGCSATSAPLTINLQPRPNFTVTASGPLAFCAGGSVSFNVSQASGQSYIWFKNNIQIPNANASSYTVTTAGAYRVRVQKNGCAKSSGTGNVTIPCREGETIDGMIDLHASVYPNPFGTQATIAFTLPGDDQVTVKVFDMDGRLVDVLVDRADFSEGPVEINYDATSLRKGLYFATITTGSYGTKTVKMSSLK